MIEKRICPVCNKEFEEEAWNRKKTCSVTCGIALKSKKIKCTCSHCGKEFMRSPSLCRGKKNLFCSYTCAGAFRHNKMELVCENCGTVFKKPKSIAERNPPKYCCKLCYTIARHRSRAARAHDKLERTYQEISHSMKERI